MPLVLNSPPLLDWQPFHKFRPPSFLKFFLFDYLWEWSKMDVRNISCT
ncbi:hypothetical protein KNP414_03886 [Paenibacillus mucilaginosus KNP414]|uniref:Uncharacterized protein n=1 Tax=Paenibacillus mucilaginosus (strain KNP414) TaxID=1036673 RepID=F8F8X6_PAEMK|nr:hypothetical protein KNP414_03886 [Paenibacillus mucilaginosus KNP414]